MKDFIIFLLLSIIFTQNLITISKLMDFRYELVGIQDNLERVWSAVNRNNSSQKILNLILQDLEVEMDRHATNNTCEET